jgi:hypothetical protein
MRDTEPLPEQIAMPDGARLATWVIYDHPTDYPDGFVLRPQYAMADGTVETSALAWYAPRAEVLRSILPPGVVCLGRSPGDDPKILEVWI